MVHSEIKHAALKLRERESSFDLDSWITLNSLNNDLNSPQPKSQALMLMPPQNWSHVARENNPKQPRNPKERIRKQIQGYKFPFRKDMCIKNRQLGTLRHKADTTIYSLPTKQAARSISCQKFKEVISKYIVIIFSPVSLFSFKTLRICKRTKKLSISYIFFWAQVHSCQRNATNCKLKKHKQSTTAQKLFPQSIEKIPHMLFKLRPKILGLLRSFCTRAWK